MKRFGYVMIGLLVCVVWFLCGMGVGLSKGIKECEQMMMINEEPCFPVGEEGWQYIYCDCCETYIWHNPNEKQEIDINLKGEKSINKLKGE